MIKRFYWKLKWLNSITSENGDPKIYRWGYWNFRFGKVKRRKENENEKIKHIDRT